MSFARADMTEDGFLGGALSIFQPRQGYRAATDPVFLAASVPARAGQTVLELGCGVGVASLCLAWRVAGVQVSGLEVQADYAALARENAARNGLALAVHDGDLQAMPADLRAQSFDHVMANPPFFREGSVHAPRDVGKSVAHVGTIDLGAWVDAGLRRLRPEGMLTVIHRAEQLPDTLAALAGRAGGIRVLPIAGRQGQPAKRVLVQARKGGRAPFELLAPFVVHSGAVHVQGQADYAPAAREILQAGAALDWGK